MASGEAKTTTAIRCATCGAPLRDTEERTAVSCGYCGFENRLISVEAERLQQKHERFAEAAREAQEMGEEVERRANELMKRFEKAQERALMSGDGQAAHEAIQCFEGYMRLQYAPTIHMYRSYDPDDPQVAAALKEIDDAVAQAVRGIAESLGVQTT